MLGAKAKDKGHKGQEFSKKKVPQKICRRPPKTKKGRRARRCRFPTKNQAFSKKKVFANFPQDFLPFSKEKEGHGHGPFLTNQKKCCQDISKDLYGLRPRT